MSYDGSGDAHATKHVENALAEPEKSNLDQPALCSTPPAVISVPPEYQALLDATDFSIDTIADFLEARKALPFKAYKEKLIVLSQNADEPKKGDSLGTMTATPRNQIPPDGVAHLDAQRIKAYKEKLIVSRRKEHKPKKGDSSADSLKAETTRTHIHAPKVPRDIEQDEHKIEAQKVAGLRHYCPLHRSRLYTPLDRDTPYTTLDRDELMRWALAMSPRE